MAEWGDTANPLTTDRLVVRVMRPHDIPTFAAYRNDPDVARHQLWDLPYTDDDAHGDLDDQADRSDVVAGRWTQLAIEHDGEVIGDVALHLDATGKVAEIGFTLAREHWGHGYATEAAGAVVAQATRAAEASWSSSAMAAARWSSSVAVSPVTRPSTAAT